MARSLRLVVFFLVKFSCILPELFRAVSKFLRVVENLLLIGSKNGPDLLPHLVFDGLIFGTLLLFDRLDLRSAGFDNTLDLLLLIISEIQEAIQHSFFVAVAPATLPPVAVTTRFFARAAEVIVSTSLFRITRRRRTLGYGRLLRSRSRAWTGIGGAKLRNGQSRCAKDAGH